MLTINWSNLPLKEESNLIQYLVFRVESARSRRIYTSLCEQYVWVHTWVIITRQQGCQQKPLFTDIVAKEAKQAFCHVLLTKTLQTGRNPPKLAKSYNCVFAIFCHFYLQNGKSNVYWGSVLPWILVVTTSLQSYKTITILFHMKLPVFMVHVYMDHKH